MTNEEIIDKFKQDFWASNYCDCDDCDNCFSIRPDEQGIYLEDIQEALNLARADERAKVVSRAADIITFEPHTKAEIKGERKTVVGKTSILRQIKNLK